MDAVNHLMHLQERIDRAGAGNETETTYVGGVEIREKGLPEEVVLVYPHEAMRVARRKADPALTNIDYFYRD